MFEQLQKILKEKYRPLWLDYCRYLRLGQQRFTLQRLSNAVRTEQIRLLESAIRKEFPLKQTLLARLQHKFVAENLSLYLLLEPLQAWQWYAGGKAVDTEAQISELISRIASPAARMLMVLNNENPSTYLPMTSLLSAMYLAAAVENKDEILQKLKKTRRFWCGKLRGLLKNAAILPAIVKSKRLKFLLAIQINTLAFKIDRLQNNKQRPTERLDRIKIFLYSIYQFITVRKRTTETKGI